jgi:hypothetical protein
VARIPSKENVFFDYLIERGYKLPQDYYLLISNERSLVDKFSVFLRGIGVRYVDARSYVVQELHKSGNVYLRSDDGHPVKIGYDAYAKAVYENLFSKQEVSARQDYSASNTGLQQTPKGGEQK